MSTLLYEVNIQVSPDIYSEYRSWLQPHAEHVCKVGGFVAYKIWELEASDAKTNREIIVHYECPNRNALNRYLTEYAPELRKEAQNLFGEKFKASRRVLVQA